jgi:hypothetical protein
LQIGEKLDACQIRDVLVIGILKVCAEKKIKGGNRSVSAKVIVYQVVAEVGIREIGLNEAKSAAAFAIVHGEDITVGPNDTAVGTDMICEFGHGCFFTGGDIIFATYIALVITVHVQVRAFADTFGTDITDAVAIRVHAGIAAAGGSREGNQAQHQTQNQRCNFGKFHG